jgi:hypothetical protein
LTAQTGAAVASAAAPPAADLVVLVPMLGRPHTVGPLLASLAATVPGVRVVFLTSPGDVEVCEAVDAAGRERIEVPRLPVGDYARKTNVGYRETTEPLIFTGACDLRFHHGWYQAACSRLTPGIGVVGTNDLGNPLVISGRHATHFLVTRAYADGHGTIDGPGAVMAEVYPHEFVDNELIGTARYRGAYAMALDSLVEHLHPHWGKAPTDAVYDAQPQRMRAGRPIYDARRPRWRG